MRICFNSLQVESKGKLHTPKRIISYDVSIPYRQSQKESKSSIFAGISLKFQFLIGRVKRQDAKEFLKEIFSSFQFLIGRVKRSPQATNIRCSKKVSIPYRQSQKIIRWVKPQTQHRSFNSLQVESKGLWHQRHPLEHYHVSIPYRQSQKIIRGLAYPSYATCFNSLQVESKGQRWVVCTYL